MRVQILDTAEEDLVEGYWFYEMQQPGLGAYFRNSIYADLHALEGTAGVHRIVYKNYHRALATRFPLRCIIPSQNKQRLYARSWIAAASQRGSENIWDKFVSALPEPTGWQLASAYLHIGAPIPDTDGS